VYDTVQQWQYWQSCNRLKNVVDFFENLEKRKVVGIIQSHSVARSGSGWVAVVPLKRGDQRGHFGI
jgi:hypothetical protein